MTRKKITVDMITDNLTGEEIKAEDAEQVDFTVHGQAYTMDVSKAEAAEFYKFLGKYEDAADKVEEKKTTRNSSASSKRDKERADLLKKIRDWAIENGHTVNPKGRISKTIVDAYEEAQK